jgi:ABC-type branched-subunit amino acid transport system ATPase component
MTFGTIYRLKRQKKSERRHRTGITKITNPNRQMPQLTAKDLVQCSKRDHREVHRLQTVYIMFAALEEEAHQWLDEAYKAKLGHSREGTF